MADSTGEKIICKGSKADGNRCTTSAKYEGYCRRHNPEIRRARLKIKEDSLKARQAAKNAEELRRLRDSNVLSWLIGTGQIERAVVTTVEGSSWSIEVGNDQELARAALVDLPRLDGRVSIYTYKGAKQVDRISLEGWKKTDAPGQD